MKSDKRELSRLIGSERFYNHMIIVFLMFMLLADDWFSAVDSRTEKAVIIISGLVVVLFHFKKILIKKHVDRLIQKDSR